MVYLNQLDYPHWIYITNTSLDAEAQERGKSTTIKSSGCGLCSAVMVADRLLPNCSFDLKDALELSYSVEANIRAGTNYKRFAPAFAKMLGLKLEMTSDPDRLRDCLRTGGVAVAHIGGDREGHIGVFSHGGHYVAVIAEEPDGRISILDPSYKENKYEEEGRQGKVEVKNGVIALCDVQVLVEDSANRTPSFYLFWRD